MAHHVIDTVHKFRVLYLSSNYIECEQIRDDFEVKIIVE